MSVAEQLQRTPRGRLRYDRRQLSPQSLQDVIGEIHTDMDSMQVRLASPDSYTSPPSFGLSFDSSGDSLLLPRASPTAANGSANNTAADGNADQTAADGSADQTAANASADRTAGPSPKSADRPAGLAERSSGMTPRVASSPNGGPATSAPRSEGSPAPLTPRAYDRLLHEEKRRHLQEAKALARDRLAAAEVALERLHRQHQKRRQQLADELRQRDQRQREQRRLERQQSDWELHEAHERIQQLQQRRAKDLSERVQAAAEQQRADEEEERRRAARERALVDQMLAAQKQMGAVIAQVVADIRGCRNRAGLQASPAAAQMDQLKKLMARMDTLVTEPTTALRPSDAEALVAEAVQLAELVSSRIETINAAAAAAADTAAKAESEPPVAPAAPPPPPSPEVAAVETESPSPATETAVSDFVQEDNLLWCDGLRAKLTQFQAGFADLLADPSLKKFKFDCQKAVNTPINAISPVSTAHLRDKLEKLRALLRGEPVTVSGQGRVTAAAHPRGVQFCLDLVAKKFVRQGEDVVSSKPEAAFALAAVLCALTLEFPELAELTLAHCQARCPYLVPMYPPQLDGDSDEAYYRKLGYDYVDGVVERQDKFLKRMSGVARLYAAVLTARPPRAAAPPRAPLGLRLAWRWLASLVNLEPRADITASLLHDLLEVAGAALAAAYGAQFFKLVRLAYGRYLARVRQATPPGCGGPLVRLEQQLNAIVRTGRVPSPPGQLQLFNW
ncbi:LOW QUALITY PROTEIN: nucleoporin GLE1-like [Pollicipes pollicipes]|uniref:LOW QUALITY PROTEIN: nucleoporin GLE1-like n=1 Tax=Pollicipes pollicipes TaxID=41117 RepID=UPI001884FC3D|nr:LOW QUALITY PROTEIN: nucleoporin GLE1-like [Pollicipes pollicipes]